jgi:hypothetical protein
MATGVPAAGAVPASASVQESPKSSSTGRPVEASSSTFAGLRSRCRRPPSWSAPSAASSCAHSRVAISGRLAVAGSAPASSGAPATNSVTV